MLTSFFFSQALNITTHVLKPGGTFVAKVCIVYVQWYIVGQSHCQIRLH